MLVLSLPANAGATRAVSVQNATAAPIQFVIVQPPGSSTRIRNAMVPAHGALSATIPAGEARMIVGSRACPGSLNVMLPDRPRIEVIVQKDCTAKVVPR